MMTIARNEIVREGVEGFYHCVARCVRRAFLCGRDEYSGRSFEHRKGWIQSRLEVLAGLFGVQVSAYAVMSNHLHVVLRTRPDLVESWPEEEVARRWNIVFPKTIPGSRAETISNDKTNRPENRPGDGSPNRERLAEWRLRLGSVSWFMRCLNENIARQANKEDGCKGRFWEGRFKCQALLDEAAVLACMAYVDLNPIRAGIVDRPERSEFTSIYERIQDRRDQEKPERHHEPAVRFSDSVLDLPRKTQPPVEGSWLCPLGDDSSTGAEGFSALTTEEYLNLIDWTGRQLRSGQRGVVPQDLAPILVRLGIEDKRWTDTVQGYGRSFHLAAGKPAALLALARRIGKQWLGGIRAGRLAFAA